MRNANTRSQVGPTKYVTFDSTRLDSIIPCDVPFRCGGLVLFGCWGSVRRSGVHLFGVLSLFSLVLHFWCVVCAASTHARENESGFLEWSLPAVSVDPMSWFGREPKTSKEAGCQRTNSRKRTSDIEQGGGGELGRSFVLRDVHRCVGSIDVAGIVAWYVWGWVVNIMCGWLWPEWGTE